MSGKEQVSIISKSAEETIELSGKFVKLFLKNKTKNKTKVVLLYGNLGSGKTTFVIGVLNYFGIKPRGVSPTFVIMKKYNVSGSNIKHIYHIDAYRMKSFDDIKTIGLDDIISNPDNLVFIEWPENIKGYNFGDAVEIKFEYGENENERRIVYGGQAVGYRI